MAISRKGRLTCVHEYPKYLPVAPCRHGQVFSFVLLQMLAVSPNQTLGSGDFTPDDFSVLFLRLKKYISGFLFLFKEIHICFIW